MDDVFLRRAAPCVVLLDDNLNIISCEDGLSELLTSVNLELIGNRLPVPLIDTIERLLHGERRDDVYGGHVITCSNLVVQANALVGNASCIAVTLQILKCRDLIGIASRRYRLSVRELEMLRLILYGLPGPAIASELHISQNTVGEHFKHLYAKAGVTNRASLVGRVLGEDLQRPGTKRAEPFVLPSPPR